MIVKIISDGVTLGDKEVVAVDPRKPFGSVLGLVLKKLGMESMEGYGMWLCEGVAPPLPVVPVGRRDVPCKVGVVQGSVLYIRKETAKERRVGVKECRELAKLRSNDEEAYRTQLRLMRQVEATRQRTAKRIHAMRLLGTEWTLLDPTSPSLEATQCTICLQHLSSASADPVSLTSCEHTYHEACLMSWIGKGTGRGSAKCPVCRKHINNNTEDTSDSDSDSDLDLPPPVIWRSR